MTSFYDLVRHPSSPAMNIYPAGISIGGGSLSQSISFNTTFDHIAGTAVVNCAYIGNLVTITISGISGAGVTGTISTITPLPALFIPPYSPQLYFPALVIQGGSNVSGWMTISNTGIITFYNGLPVVSFNTSSQNGFQGTSVSFFNNVLI